MLRAKHLKPLCENCLKQGRYTTANTLDHHDPTWSSFAEFSNPKDKKRFNSLCKKCHIDKTFEIDIPRQQLHQKLKLEFF